MERQMRLSSSQMPWKMLGFDLWRPQLRQMWSSLLLSRKTLQWKMHQSRSRQWKLWLLRHQMRSRNRNLRKGHLRNLSNRQSGLWWYRQCLRCFWRFFCCHGVCLERFDQCFNRGLNYQFPTQAYVGVECINLLSCKTSCGTNIFNAIPCQGNLMCSNGVYVPPTDLY